ncbi:hypothetical protein INT43_000377 [Umbelopsis isabellina]|uniref:chitinase n=1 Tax=Mortierella isabellina TaxID=91625 RepID=A0A8H7Q364_MORIS|nr:hypothetical protein INT43_000377 [Umbelopsis isabellina]
MVSSSLAIKGAIGAAVMLASATISQAFSADGINYVNYWGQNSYGAAGGAQSGWQKNLASYCEDSVEDVLVLSFLTTFFGTGNEPVIDFSNTGNGCTTFDGTALLNCPQIGQDIKTCQAKGKKIILALGGASGSYGFTSDSQASGFADTLWNTFGAGNSSTRPFGDAVIDGFDLDIEGGSATGYTAMIEQLRTHYASDSSKDYYITGAPQCPFPDAYLGDALNNAWFDFVWVQFYNNYCSVQGTFNFDTWDNWASTQAKNPNVKVYLGVPGSTSAASSGYVPYSTLTTTIDSLKSYKSFGGVMMWDASQAYGNTDVSPNYATAVSSYLHSGKSSSSGGASTSAASSTSKGSASSTGKASTTSASATSSSAAASATPSSGTPACPTAGGSCTSGYACAGSSVAICDNGKWVLTACPSSLVCTASADGSSAYCNYNTGAASTCAVSNAKKLVAGSAKVHSLSVTSSSSPKTASAIPKTKSTDAQVSYFVDTSKNTQFQASFNVRNKANKPISNKWTLTFTAPDGQQVQKSSVGKVSQKGNQVTITANRKKVPAIMEAIVVDVSGSHNGTVFQAVDPNTIDFSW